MSIELEHAIGCNVGFKSICHFHPNGNHYVKAVGGVVIVGDLSDPHEQTFLHGHDDFITCLAVSNDGRLAASGQQGQNADVILWDLNSRRQLYCFQEQDHGIDCLCFSFDDRYLFSAGMATDARVFVYDTQSGLIICWAQLHPKPTISVVSGGFVRDIKRRDTHEYQFAACGGKTIAVWHLDAMKGEMTPQQIGNAGKQTREYTSLAFASDYEHLFAGTTTGDVAVVLMKNRVVQQFIPCCSGGVTMLICIPAQGGTRLAVGGGDGTATILSGPTPCDIREERQVTLDGPLMSMSLSSNKMDLLTVSSQGTAYLMRTKDLAVKVHNQVSSGALYDVAYVAGVSELFLTCCGDGLVTLWDANDYSAKLRCPVRTRSYPTAVAATEDILVAGCNDGRLQSYDCAQGQNLWHIDNAHKGGVTSVKLASNCRFIVSGGVEGDLRIWEMKTRDMASHLSEHKGRITEVQIFPNDQYAISCSRDRCLLTWDLRQQKRLTAHRERHGGINCLAVAANQTTVYTAGQERQLTYWDLRMADPIAVYPMEEEIHSISLSPDGQHLAMAGTGLVVKVWDLNQHAVVSRGVGHSRPIQKVTFSPDGKQVVSVGLDHAALVWNFYA
eukprot:CAMPEP_0177326478 /NCGR_PEP_ID=MMETSP0368-20130122/18364_1 /TAXON_ID=447022 ORGANISM="Scrippsiella hangoei-like, Strain SHHI-4" /NCGR_SAMPLE_ID=MMETSP0368 /ASSEMBLY_ACC=CAM_ASM_000363 /LENGTH=612 /DNA_ID=CAMNT_0018786447 /DNA_START=51 /DNA_END=1889 /DNA_ORIENTATION=+